jgi:hypothetical protein
MKRATNAEGQSRNHPDIVPERSRDETQRQQDAREQIQ